jgi:hypothetical protein
MISAAGTIVLLTLALDPIVCLARAWQVQLLEWQPFAQPGIDRLGG